MTTVTEAKPRNKRRDQFNVMINHVEKLTTQQKIALAQKLTDSIESDRKKLQDELQFIQSSIKN